MSTISEIANRAEVSEATVSKVINGTGSISGETISRVRRVMGELNYKPRPNKRRLHHIDFSKRQLNIAAFLVPDTREDALHTSLSSGTIYGIEDVLYKHGASLVATHLRDDGNLPPCIEKRQVDALFIRGGYIDCKLLASLKNFPVVWIYPSSLLPVPGDRIQPDDEAIGQIAADYLIRNGCRKLMFFNPNRRHSSFHMRAESFRVSAMNRGVPVDGVSVPEGEILADKTGDFKKILLPHTGFFIAGFNSFNNEDLVAEVLRRHFPGTKTAGATSRRLTEYASIGVAPEDVGREAAQMMLKRFSEPGAEYRKIMMPPKLIYPEG